LWGKRETCGSGSEERATSIGKRRAKVDRKIPLSQGVAGIRRMVRILVVLSVLIYATKSGG
jgi:hypothetical protein